MCKMFEKVTGRRTKGSVDKLEGLTKMYRDHGEDIVIINIPTDMMEIDSRYQTDDRTERDLRYLTDNWDERKLMPLIGVPHWEEGKVYVVDGYGRWIASQIVDKKKYKDLKVLLLLNAPIEPEDRLVYEAEVYAYQNKQVKQLTPIQKHGAFMILHDEATETLEKMRKKYGFEYTNVTGMRGASVLGSYSYTLKLCNVDNGKAAKYVFDICAGAGFDRKPNGYATYIMKALKDVYTLYAKDRMETKKYIIKKFREITPYALRANSVVKYPMLDMKTAVSLYVEDMVVDGLGLEQTREVVNSKVTFIKKVSA